MWHNFKKYASALKDCFRDKSWLEITEEKIQAERAILMGIYIGFTLVVLILIICNHPFHK